MNVHEHLNQREMNAREALVREESEHRKVKETETIVKKQESEEFNLQKELEKKFDELFGASD
ncbi:hypothetical protein D3C73_1155400 [compost metagenome]